jgi:ribosomal small subunit protein bTHX
MGKGDQRTKRGKLFRGSRGKATQRKARPAARPEVKPAPRARAPRPAPAEVPPPPPPTEAE